MKNRINFFREDLKPKIILLNLNFVLAMTVLSILLVIVGALWASNQHTLAKQNVENLVSQTQQKKFMVDSLREAKDTRTHDMSIVADIEKNQQELNIKHTILDELASRETQRSNGFSDLMQGLAVNHQSYLWLTEILINERTLYIEGFASDSDALPKWLSKLGKTDYFSGKSFADARIKRNEQNVLSFALSSELDGIKEARQ